MRRRHVWPPTEVLPSFSRQPPTRCSHLIAQNSTIFRAPQVMPPHQGIKARWGDPKLGGDRIAVELVASLLYPIDRFLYPAHDLFLALRLATAAAALSDALQQVCHTSRALNRIGACASLS